ncbi:MAG: hypothetical protein RMJ07_06285 [Nitrososphaerota archaeon]|nr:hypothetical protein [Candidatus Bathyarchaeota archaeon]MDW8049268.1 hypothetical protein [Nitrososphaerota archaeon]
MAGYSWDAKIVGSNVIDVDGREIGSAASLIYDFCGQVKEILVVHRNEYIKRYPIEQFRVYEDGIILRTDIDDKIEFLLDTIPLVRRKKKVLDRLLNEERIPKEVYEQLNEFFSRMLGDAQSSAKGVLIEINKQIRMEEDNIKKLHLARIFLEIEHGMGNLKDEIYQRSIASILTEVKNTSYRRARLQRCKERIKHLLESELEEQVESSEPELTGV